MPFWRVVVESQVGRSARACPPGCDRAIAGVFVWARTIEEAEGLAALALEAEGLLPVTVDALKAPPTARPSREPNAVARTAIGFLQRAEHDAPATPSARI
jgi:hypothetical protein